MKHSITHNPSIIRMFICTLTRPLLITLFLCFSTGNHTIYTAQLVVKPDTPELEHNTAPETPPTPELEQEEIKEAAAYDEEEEKDAPQKLTQLLTIFLDDSESIPGTRYSAPTTSTFLNALYDKAGPIIASTSLLYNLISGPMSKNKTEIAQQFKKDFYNDGKWILDDPDQWKLKEITKHLMIAIPTSYLKEKNISLEQVGLQVAQATPITIDAIKQRYSALPIKDWYTLDNKTGTIFFDALLKPVQYKKNLVYKNNLIFDQTNKNVEWVIYLTGHGDYQSSVASIDLKNFPFILDFFDTKISIALFAYDSCFAAGANTEAIYGELTRAGGGGEYSFPIVTAAITDAETTTTLPKYANEKLVFYLNFKKFIDNFIDHKWPPEESLKYILPDIEAYQHGKKAVDYRGNLPQIRFAYSPAWFPIIESTKSVVRITKNMALTRQEPLLLGAPVLKKPSAPGEKPTREKQFVRAVLLDTDYIPFDIVITKDTAPNFIITMPGNAKIYLEKIIEENPMDILYFSQIMSLDPFIPLYKRHKGKKQLYISELIIASDDIKTPPRIYRNLIFNYASDASALYYTDENNSQWIIEGNNPPEPYLHQNYLSQFAALLFINQKNKENQLLKSLAFQKLPHLIGKKTMPAHNIKQFEKKLTRIKEQEEKLKANESLKNTILTTITQIQDSVLPYKELLEPYFNELELIGKKENVTNEDVDRVHTISKDFNDFLRWPEITKSQCLKVMHRTQKIVATVQQMPDFPQDKKGYILDTFDQLKTLLYKNSCFLKNDRTLSVEFISYYQSIDDTYEQNL